ncbi:Do/DeqQ family serine protease [Rhizobium sp. SG_E_25_P2]|uniref:DegQ family serine endoprotease n=1 Tax=Rhizobium sp. SG_E_25_P2 TaxID=2879942 RepID=UPI00247452CD|nr:DegQ family serine endoprotease [Rhizobium sp. SG_E_25_P2]MDH6268957.1 Do/DeqQ family serine protease [Rhizobium sp. SG_E_25_P2]
MLFRPRILLMVMAVSLAAPVGAEESRTLPQSRAEIQLSFAPLVKQTAGAVVNVYAEKVVQRPSLYSDPFFQEFFGQRLPNRTEKQSSLGSGVIIGKDGLVVTNNHVISGADDIKIALSDGREYSAKVTFKDERLDLALLKVQGGGSFEALPIGDSDGVEVGDLVLAVGNPFGVGQTVTSGIVSALARNRVGEGDFSFFIQTDASINPGNSGGALINMHGELIGLNTAIVSRDGGSNGIGFAIPANLVKVFIEAGRGGQSGFTRPYVGASFEPVTSEVAEALGLKLARGALVTKIVKDGPADKAGLRPGEVVTAVNGRAVEHPDALGYRLTTAGLGSTVTLAVSDNGEEREIRMTLQQAPETRPKDERLIDGRNPFAGALVANLSPRLAQELQMPAEATGVVIQEISRGSPAARLGFAPRDIIIAVNGQEITSTEGLQSILESDPNFWRVEIDRGGQRIRQFIR